MIYIQAKKMKKDLEIEVFFAIAIIDKNHFLF